MTYSRLSGSFLARSSPAKTSFCHFPPLRKLARVRRLNNLGVYPFLGAWSRRCENGFHGEYQPWDGTVGVGCFEYVISSLGFGFYGESYGWEEAVWLLRMGHVVFVGVELLAMCRCWLVKLSDTGYDCWMWYYIIDRFDSYVWHECMKFGSKLNF